MIPWYDEAPTHLDLSMAKTNTLLPGRSADLNPLEYGLFGTAKHHTRAWTHGTQGLGWDDACNPVRITCRA